MNFFNHKYLTDQNVQTIPKLRESHSTEIQLKNIIRSSFPIVQEPSDLYVRHQYVCHLSIQILQLSLPYSFWILMLLEASLKHIQLQENIFFSLSILQKVFPDFQLWLCRG